MGLIDLFSVLPYYLPLFFPHNLLFLRILRLFRLFRIFKLIRYSDSLRIIGSAVSRIKSELVSTLIVTSIILIISANLMFIIENEAQPDAFTDMGQALWWAVATLTTVGYGDIFPVTMAGKIISSFMALLGIGIVAIPSGLLASAFMKEMEESKKQKTEKVKECKCPNCGFEFEE
jgi:voltage-gated potassium channel